MNHPSPKTESHIQRQSMSCKTLLGAALIVGSLGAGSANTDAGNDREVEAPGD